MRSFALARLALAASLLSTATAFAGDLNPSAAPGSTMVTLDELNDGVAAATDARTPLDSLPGSISGVVAIASPGSYYLRGDLIGQVGKNGIEISTGNVTIDLNGFRLVGGAGTLRGIAFTGSLDLPNIAVKNGSIVDWGTEGIGRVGIVSAFNSRLSDLSVRGGGAGVSALTSSTLTRLNIQGCSGYGLNANISVHADCTVGGVAGDGFLGSGVFENCVATSNTGDGFRVATGARLQNCYAGFNNLDGFELVGAKADNCTAHQNGENGFHLNASECEVTNCYADFNGSAAGTQAGIRAAGLRGVVDGNTVVSNTDIGVQVTGADNLIVRNRARNNGAGNFSVVAGNRDAQLVSPGSAFVSTDPWANMAF